MRVLQLKKSEKFVFNSNCQETSGRNEGFSWGFKRLVSNETFTEVVS